MGRGKGKKKIEIKRVENDDRRMVTFSKRRQGLFKKAQQLHALTDSHVAVLAFSPAGRPYTHCSSSFSFDAVVDRYLNGCDGEGGEEVQKEVHDLSSWWDAMMIRIEDRDRSAEKLIFLKNILGEIRGKVEQKIQED